MQQERMCPYCHGGNAPNASQCQWCHRYLQTESRRTWGWLLIGAGFVSFALLFVAFTMLIVQAFTDRTSVPFLGAGIVLAGIVVLLILPGIMLVRWKKR